MGTVNQRPVPQPFEQYHHFKGKDYQVITLATKEDDGQQLVIYQALYDDHKIWARSLSSFLGKVDRDKYPDATQTWRFVRLGDEEEQLVDVTAEAGDDTAAISDNPEDGDLEGMDSRVLDFLDADSNMERLDILASLHADITDDIIDTLAVASGLEIEPGPVETRYHDLRECLVTISKYELEGNRLR